MIRTLAMLILFSFMCQAQTPGNKVPVSFKVDGKKQAVSYKVKLSLDGQVIEPAYVEGGFIMPPIFTAQELDDDKKVGIKMILDDKEINFSSVTPTRAFIMRYAKEWLIVIDNKPFEPAVLPSGAVGEYLKEHSQVIYRLEITSKISGGEFVFIIGK